MCWGPDIYPLIGVIERWDGAQLTHRLLDFPLRLVLTGGFDRSLEDGDVVHLFSNAQIRALEVKETLSDGAKSAALGSRGDESDEVRALIEDEAMAGFLRERSAFLRGAVRHTGAYPVAEGVFAGECFSGSGRFGAGGECLEH